MNCANVEPYLCAWLDGELDPSARVEVDRHLAGCPTCVEQLMSLRAMRDRLRACAAEGRMGRASEALRLRVSSALKAEREPAWWRLDSSWRATVAAAALALVVFGLGGSIDSDVDTSQAGVVPLLDDVMRMHSRGLPTEVRARDQVPAYFQERVGFRVSPVDFRDPGVHFVGARDAQVGGRAAATLHYKVRGRRLTVVAFKPPMRAARLGEPVSARNGRVVRAVRVRGDVVPLVERDGVVYVVVSDLDAEDRLELAAQASLR